MKRNAFLFSAALCAALPFMPVAHAATWDATADFNLGTTSNPNGAWSYGYSPGAVAGYSFKAFDQYSSAGGVLHWEDSVYGSLRAPTFYKNNTLAAFNGLAPGMVALHPGPAANTDRAILRFTAPATDFYTIVGQFFDGDSGETDASIVKNEDFGTQLASLGFTSLNPTFALNGIALNAGDRIDFVVGNVGNFFFDTTPLSVRISSASGPIPEPGTLLMAAMGLGLLGASKRRYKI